MRRRILILGLPYFGNLLRDVLRGCGWDAQYREHPGKDPRAWARLLPLVARADVIYLIGSRIDRRSPQAFLAMLRRRPVIIHWVGTDVVFARDEYFAGRSSERLIRQAIHLADAPWLVDELAELGIEADYVPLPVPSLCTGEPPPLPETFRVLLYYPIDPIDREVFDWETMVGLAKELPAVEFRLVPSPPETLPAPPPPNLRASGWVRDMDALYRDISVYVRLTAHDGTSFMAIEALSRGRYVIWTFPMTGAIQARGFEEVSTALRELWERHQRGELGLNESGRAGAVSEFDPERLGSALDARLKEALGVRRSTRRSTPRVGAIDKD